MNIFIASVIWVTVEASVPSLAIDPIEVFTTREVLTPEAQCPNNCQGDFPVSSNRKYAEAKHDARGTELHGIARN